MIDEKLALIHALHSTLFDELKKQELSIDDDELSNALFDVIINSSPSKEYVSEILGRIKELPAWLKNEIITTSRAKAGGKSSNRKPEKLTTIGKIALAALSDIKLNELTKAELQEAFELVERSYAEKLIDKSEDYSDEVTLAKKLISEMDVKKSKPKETNNKKYSILAAILKTTASGEIEKAFIEKHKDAIYDNAKLFLAGNAGFSVSVSPLEKDAAVLCVKNDGKFSSYQLFEDNKVIPLLAKMAGIKNSCIVLDDRLDEKIINGLDDEDLFNYLAKGLAESKPDLTFDILEKSEERQIVYGVVMEPEATDTHGEVASADVIEQLAHDYLMNSQTIKLQHIIPTSGAKIIESYIAPMDLKINGNDVVKGSWIMAMKVLDNDIWENIKIGKYTGFSIHGIAVREPING